MTFESLHHITAITGDVPRNVDFYARARLERLLTPIANPRRGRAGRS
ncbi:MAG: hypothetical protein ACR2H2_05410 [Solirubrobacteraceae bacterium]